MKKHLIELISADISLTWWSFNNTALRTVIDVHQSKKSHLEVVASVVQMYSISSDKTAWRWWQHYGWSRALDNYRWNLNIRLVWNSNGLKLLGCWMAHYSSDGLNYRLKILRLHTFYCCFMFLNSNNGLKFHILDAFFQPNSSLIFCKSKGSDNHGSGIQILTVKFNLNRCWVVSV